MKIVIALDSFKECMSAMEAGTAVQDAIREYDAAIQTQLIPMSDGGEGTLETLMLALQGHIEEYDVCGVRFQNIKAPIGFVEDCAIIECAKVCGLELLKDQKKDPAYTTTYGLGELIRKALDHHVSRIMIGLGGSATNDGGIGMLSALGARFEDRNHQPIMLTMSGLKDIAYVDFSHLDKRLFQVSLQVICDVSNPLCGRQGATYVYGKQKGIKPQDCAMIDASMLHYAQLVDDYFQTEYRYAAGAGAAGGLGYALLICRGQLKKGFDLISEMVSLPQAIQECDKVIVGEGKMDFQTQYGKTPYGVLKLAQQVDKEVYAFAGKVEDLDVLKSLGFQNVFAITPSQMPLDEALKCGKENLKNCVKAHMEEILWNIK